MHLVGTAHHDAVAQPSAPRAPARASCPGHRAGPAACGRDTVRRRPRPRPAGRRGRPRRAGTASASRAVRTRRSTTALIPGRGVGASVPSACRAEPEREPHHVGHAAAADAGSGSGRRSSTPDVVRRVGDGVELGRRGHTGPDEQHVGLVDLRGQRQRRRIGHRQQGLAGCDRRPSASAPSTEADEPLLDPPSTLPAWLCRPSGSCEMRRLGVAARRAARRWGQRDRARDRRPDDQGRHGTPSQLDGRAGLHPLRGRQGGDRLREAADAGRELCEPHCRPAPAPSGTAPRETCRALSACRRAAGTVIRAAARRARANDRWATASACRAAERSTVGARRRTRRGRPRVGLLACRRSRRADGDSTRRSTCPVRTCWPSCTRSSATVPSAGDDSVAVARAATVAGASTTSTTVARPTGATTTSGSPPPVQPASARVATATSTAAARRPGALTDPS